MGLVDFGFGWWGGDGRRSFDDAPVTIQRGFGHPGVRTLRARCPICSTAARTRPGRVVRHGSYTWVGCTVLRQPKGAGSSCRPHRSSSSIIAEAAGSREQRRKRLGRGGASRRSSTSVRPQPVSARRAPRPLRSVASGLFRPPHSQERRPALDHL